MNKKGQIKISFGMIFSVIMIVIFLVFAFYAIRTFFGIQETAQTGKFIDDLQSDVNTIWRSTEGSQERTYRLSKKISHVCFGDFERDGTGPRQSIYGELEFNYFGSENIFFYPTESSNPGSFEIKNVDILEITLNENPYCIDNEDGTLELVLIKDFGEPLVKIERAN
ncbi:MAG: hypothetical protein WDZ62_01795 [Candidatus Pacearchaeota archaeon]